MNGEVSTNITLFLLLTCSSVHYSHPAFQSQTPSRILVLKSTYCVYIPLCCTTKCNTFVASLAYWRSMFIKLSSQDFAIVHLASLIFDNILFIYPCRRPIAVLNPQVLFSRLCHYSKAQSRQPFVFQLSLQVCIYDFVIVKRSKRCLVFVLTFRYFLPILMSWKLLKA